MWVGSIPRVLSAVVAFPKAFLDSTVATVCRMIFSPKAFMLFGCSVFRAAPGCWLPQLSSLSLPAAFSKRLSRPKRPYVVNSLPQGFLAALHCCASLGRCPLKYPMVGVPGTNKHSPPHSSVSRKDFPKQGPARVSSPRRTNERSIDFQCCASPDVVPHQHARVF